MKRWLWLLSAVLLTGVLQGCPGASKQDFVPGLPDNRDPPDGDVAGRDTTPEVDVLDEVDLFRPDCFSDKDCPEGTHCDPKSLTCVECFLDIHCPPEMVCHNRRCVDQGTCEAGWRECSDIAILRECVDGTGWEFLDCPPGTICREDLPGQAECAGCRSDCSPIPQGACGPDGCGGLCDFCEKGTYCPAGALYLSPGSAVKCQSGCTCAGLECGVNACGEWCGDCKDGLSCVENRCVGDGLDCADGWACAENCQGTDVPGTCRVDCVEATNPVARDRLVVIIECISGFCGEFWEKECVQKTVDSFCQWAMQDCVNCVPSCEGLQCGPDGCGGQCGQCPPGLTCLNGQCGGQGGCGQILECIRNMEAPTEVTIPMCLAGATQEAQEIFLRLSSCVEAVCNGFFPWDECFEMAINTVCRAEYQLCVECVPTCQGKQCGPDGCGGQCGQCPGGYLCQSGLCLCQPKCGECGPDGCGGICGVCADGWYCSPDGKCNCVPDCVGKQCGSDGCGSICGTCAPSAYCSVGGSCIPYTCQPGQSVCDGNLRLVCNDNGDWTVMGPCPPGTYCANGNCLPWVCEPGTSKCDGNAVVTCSDSGAGWLQPVPCPPATQCQGGICFPFGDCGPITDIGCCDGNRAVFCFGGTVVVEQCGDIGCGWIPGLGYGCGGMGADPTGQYPYHCPGVCVPNCAGKQCGPDGCGGLCGQCPAGTTCLSELLGICIPDCLPSCEGKECGNDGCGGDCGVCGPTMSCVNGRCMVPPTCGQMLDCALGCFSQGQSCFGNCSIGGEGTQLTRFKNLWSCLTTTCANNPSSQCLNNALVGTCYQHYLACVTCEPACAGKQCGPDGCGGTCGACPDTSKCENGKCIPLCFPDCAGRECGDNGCGGVCGVCEGGWQCIEGRCEPPCQPSCFGKQCGPDGCGGTCGLCPPGSQCSPQQICVPLTWCGDGICDATMGETCNSCPLDCGSCPTGCEPLDQPGCSGCPCEACVCQMDPFCCYGWWDDWCAKMCFECGGCGCVPQCQNKQCGPDGCGGTCGTCGPNAQCTNGVCVPVCVPDCVGKQCGSNGCGGICGTCPSGQTCKSGTCFKGLSCAQMINCAIDCLTSSSDGTQCVFQCMEQGDPSEQQEFFALAQCILNACGTQVNTTCMMNALNGTCQQQYNVCIQCQPSCAGKQCGPNGCGGSCGTCPSGTHCDNYLCKPVCTPQCAGKMCGPDGCGGQCGVCADKEQCVSGICVPLCIPDCFGRQCGPDGCGGTCGFCPPGMQCTPMGTCIPLGPVCGDNTCDVWGGESCQTCPMDCGPCHDGCKESPFPGCGGCVCEQCVCQMAPWCCFDRWDIFCVDMCYQCGGCGCIPQCANKQCGPDACGGSCGSCPPGTTCENGLCKTVCYPSCMGKQCGPNGCGGSCGVCPSGFLCSAQGSCVPSCVPDCTGKQCGPDGCNGQCGICGPDQACVQGKCKTSWTCEQLLNCVWACPEDNGDDCFQGCFQNASPAAQSQYMNIWQCVIDACGPNPSDQCVGQAIWFGACREKYNACRNCTPACTGKQCGDDGCGGSCGQCPVGYECDVFGYCDCVPHCPGKECGSDGCHGVCGYCPAGYECNFLGKCVCMPACQNVECGNDGCGGTCGLCPVGYKCSFGICVPTCVPSCQDKQCGSDGCGGSCGVCPPGWNCTPWGWCEPPMAICGDGFCDPGWQETCLTCPMDCGPCSGDCCKPNPTPGCDDPFITKCVCGMDPFCCDAFWDDYCVASVEMYGCGTCGCAPQCVSSDGSVKQCGPDGCGGSCGVCPVGTTCNSQGKCISTCVPNCAGKQCGPNGCGGSCGTCPAGSTCNPQGQCTPICTPNCAGKQCGPNGCGGSCGTCELGKVCNTQGQCISMCTPNCTGKQCGPDGCGGFCGTCGLQEACNSFGQCVCMPNCTGKQCGSDGCGGSCGTCAPFQSCTASGQCAYVTPLCGDGNCMAILGETCDSCPKDCGPCCGNGQCQAGYGETCLSCPKDCGVCCGNGFCQPQFGESCETCPKDCGACPVKCGDGNCDTAFGEDCATCPADCGVCPAICGDGWCEIPKETCETCPADCGLCPAVCGDGECEIDGGEDCVSCPSDCGTCPTWCGDGWCQDNEDCVTCPSDCGPCPPQCGDGWCNTPTETCHNCPKDCGDCGDCCVPHDTPGCADVDIQKCVCAQDSFCCDAYWDDICVEEVSSFGCGSCGCIPQCVGANGQIKQCGPDGCGGTCGICPPGAQCTAQGQCLSVCLPNCSGKQCGPDGCGGTCGTCPAGSQCTAQGKCISVCIPSCFGKQCGPNGCGGSCGTCPSGFLCNSQGLCQPSCVPDCFGKQCGPDGCNGQCGICGADQACVAGRCQTAWSCEQLLNCVWACPEGDEACTSACFENASPEAQSQYIDIWMCVLDVCGQSPSDECVGQAIWFGACREAFNACRNCTPACTGKQCGSDGCGGTCGVCPPGYECDDFGNCDCVPSCTGKECGSDGCGGSCGQCPANHQCNNQGKCVCVPDCVNAECGSDGCGGSCGTCPPGWDCLFGLCTPSCVPNCDGLQCGSDGCGGSCGECPDGWTCAPWGQCDPPSGICGDGWCDPNWGESCLTCEIDCGFCTGECCQANQTPGCEDPFITRCVCEMDPFCCEAYWDDYCVSLVEMVGCGTCGCTPQCVSEDGQQKQCGPDGCGGSCGTCPPGSECTPQGQCQGGCIPNCTNKECGPNGCGGSCGTCAAGRECSAAGICQNISPNHSCSQIFSCALGCGGNSGCMALCYADGSPQGQAHFEKLMTCILTACPLPWNTQCLMMALVTTCQSQYQACMAN